ncbi:MAG: DUF3841 domain-containing protein [Acidobacteria bacterium]|nr:DUF3841 domain-containing protein [Acidobacteriota bacterium]
MIEENEGERAWERVRRVGVLRADGRRVYPFSRPAYRWMADQMRRRVPSCRCSYPVWAWHVPKPDLRCACHLEPGTPGVCIEFEMPRQRVLLSSLDAWMVALNDGYLSLTKEKDDR